MPRIRLRIGCQRKSKALFSLARKQRQLFRHGSGILREKDQSVETHVEYEIIKLPRLRLLDCLSGLGEALQGEEVIAEVDTGAHVIGCEAKGLAGHLYRLLILSLLRVHEA